MLGEPLAGKGASGAFWRDGNTLYLDLNGEMYAHRCTHVEVSNL